MHWLFTREQPRNVINNTLTKETFREKVQRQRTNESKRRKGKIIRKKNTVMKNEIKHRKTSK